MVQMKPQPFEMGLRLMEQRRRKREEHYRSQQKQLYDSACHRDCDQKARCHTGLIF